MCRGAQEGPCFSSAKNKMVSSEKLGQQSFFHTLLCYCWQHAVGDNGCLFIAVFVLIETESVGK